jgi:D-glycero-alpha-D-manno-heptose-7-phosphate kinase
MKKFILVRSPMRISFVGGGTDFKDYYNKFDGLVFNTSINKYVYIAINQFHDINKCLLKYSKSEHVKKLDAIEHPLIKNALSLTKLWGLDINSIADIPSGTGLGSSSSFTVGLIHALNSIKKKKINRNMLAESACKVEINMAKSPIGKQDQYSAAFGGLNKFEFKKNENVKITNFNNKIDTSSFKNNLIIFNTGIQKKNFKILKEQKKNIKSGSQFKNLHQMKESVNNFIKYLKMEDYKVCGDIIDYNWNLKKKLSTNINNNFFNEVYNLAKKNGAYGGKILGAGGRGYLLLIAPKKNHRTIKKKLYKLEELKFNFDTEGSKILYEA